MNDSLPSAADFDRAAPYVPPPLANQLIFPFEQMPGCDKQKSAPSLVLSRGLAIGIDLCQ